MGIVKIRHRGAWKTSQERRTSRTSKFDEPVQENFLKITNDEFADSEIGCELATVSDQICNIPYELYDLSNLEDVLSLETWNSYLTEEERFHLTTYLPDTDQDTYGCTLKELLSGHSLFFGSPVDKFFDNLKGGFYSLEVTRAKSCLEKLRKREYYHSLRMYHEKMSQTFIEMRTVWRDCGLNASVEERVRVWNKRKERKPVLLVDLNALPVDEEISSKCENVGMNTNVRGKGLLKLRPARDDQLVQPYLRPPKGVLKIKPKYDPNVLEIRQDFSFPLKLNPTSRIHADDEKLPTSGSMFPITYKRKKPYMKSNMQEWKDRTRFNLMNNS